MDFEVILILDCFANLNQSSNGSLSIYAILIRSDWEDCSVIFSPSLRYVVSPESHSLGVP